MTARTLAIYDMDKTITRGATWTPFLRHVAQERGLSGRVGLGLAAAAGGGYLLRLYDRGRLKELTHRFVLGRADRAGRMPPAARRFAEATVATGVLAAARARIEADRAEGCMLVMATASYRLYAAEIAGLLGFDAVVATDTARCAAGGVLPRIDGENCYGPGKLRMIEAWAEQAGIRRDAVRVRFYSDHVSDAPVFEWADEAFAVNAHPPLRRMARARGWTLLDWRD